MPGDAAVGGRQADRAAAVGADRAGDHARADRARRAAGRAAADVLRVPRVADRAVGGLDAGRAAAEVVHVGDGDDDRARVAQAAVDARLAGGERPRRAVPSRGARHGMRNWSLTAIGTPCSGPCGASASIRSDSSGNVATTALSGAVALLDPLERGAQQLAGVEIAGCDPRRLLAQREVLWVAHEVGARLGSRSGSGPHALHVRLP